MNNFEKDLGGFKPDLNEELYADIAFQMLSAYIQSDNKMTTSLFESLTKYEDPLLLPGILYGCIMHMGILLATLAESNLTEIKDVFELYAKTYNSEIREKLAEMPAMYPKYANSMLNELEKHLEKGD